jgi:hypothetical protein
MAAAGKPAKTMISLPAPVKNAGKPISLRTAGRIFNDDSRERRSDDRLYFYI